MRFDKSAFTERSAVQSRSGLIPAVFRSWDLDLLPHQCLIQAAIKGLQLTRALEPVSSSAGALCVNAT